LRRECPASRALNVSPSRPPMRLGIRLKRRG
jgi:hypothetical protein